MRTAVATDSSSVKVDTANIRADLAALKGDLSLFKSQGNGCLTDATAMMKSDILSQDRLTDRLEQFLEKAERTTRMAPPPSGDNDDSSVMDIRDIKEALVRIEAAVTSSNLVRSTVRLPCCH